MFLRLFRNYHHRLSSLVNHNPLVYSGKTILQHQQRSLLNSFIRMADKTLDEQIKQQGDLVRSLKSQKADKEKVIFLFFRFCEI